MAVTHNTAANVIENACYTRARQFLSNDARSGKRLRVMHMKSRSYKIWMIIVVACIAFSPPAGGDASGPQWLAAVYQSIRGKLNDGAADIPLYVRSDEHEGVFNADVYGIVDYPVRVLVDALTIPASWCESTTLHPNIKHCTYELQDDSVLFTFYLARSRKPLRSLQHAYELKLKFRVLALSKDYFKVLFEGNEGSMDTRNHRFQLEAIPVADSAFVRVKFSYQSHLMSRLATTIYLGTFSPNRIGFSMVGIDNDGQPIYVKGNKGLLERHVVRSYLAVIAFMHTRDVPAEDRFEAQMNRWYDLAERYVLQLHEMERHEYIEVKRQEREKLRPLQAPVAVRGMHRGDNG